ncbi:hypothetical protein ACVFI8_16595 [Agarivorans sp. MS3-6]|uniref:hypothetical protein n=1 Tax=Agarivorans sp. TSD2052 TaxID=2937286 RepID=UPI00200D24F6|nr:hypothetical protein [Agarivorans sp. TSD2052]UPW17517.1 hypothetical protein M0C34_14905 [Agarivorans sp. TSD2052]
MEQWLKQKVASFELKVFSAAEQKKPIHTYRGTGRQWHQYLSLSVATSFESANADLSGIWKELITNKSAEFKAKVEFLECIIKWDDTMLMKWPYLVHIKVKYR